MLLPSALRSLRSAQGGAAASFLGAAWRGLAGASGGAGAASGGGGQGASEAAAAGPAEQQQQAAQPPETQQLHEHIISVDRSGLINPAPHSHDPEVLAAQAAAAGVVKEPETALGRHLRTIIQVWPLEPGLCSAICTPSGRHLRCCRPVLCRPACSPAPLSLPSSCNARPNVLAGSLAAAPSRWQSTLARC